MFEMYAAVLCSEPFSSVHYRAAVTHSMPHIVVLFVYTLTFSPSGCYQTTYYSL